jgi:curved DNA-binding protein CbpA
MVSLYEILEVPATATKDESMLLAVTHDTVRRLTHAFFSSRIIVKKAYKSMALKTHPDRVPPEQKSRAEAAFQKVL